MRAAVITVSDRSAAGEREDLAGGGELSQSIEKGAIFGHGAELERTQ